MPLICAGLQLDKVQQPTASSGIHLPIRDQEQIFNPHTIVGPANIQGHRVIRALMEGLKVIPVLTEVYGVLRVLTEGPPILTPISEDQAAVIQDTPEATSGVGPHSGVMLLLPVPFRHRQEAVSRVAADRSPAAVAAEVAISAVGADVNPVIFK